MTSHLAEVCEFDGVALADAPPMSPYLKALVRNGPGVFLDNAHVTVRLLAVDGAPVPLVIGEPGPPNADVCSPCSHYALYTIEEFRKRHPVIPSWSARLLAAGARALFRWCAVDRVVCVNNWLFATNPHQPFSREQIEGIQRHLVARYPRHAIVFRTVTPRLHAEHSDRLRACGFVPVKARKVYLLDLRGPRPQKRGLREDLRLLKTGPYEIVGNDQLQPSDMPRLETLYRGLYLEKHSYLNPQFSRHFFEFMWRHDLLVFRALRGDGRIDGFICFFIRDNLMIGVAIGYDLTLPRELGLYRRVMALLVEEAQRRRVWLHLSAGAGRFKELRGAVPCPEYDAVYLRHLSPRQRTAWRLFQFQGKLW